MNDLKISDKIIIYRSRPLNFTMRPMAWEYI